MSNKSEIVMVGVLMKNEAKDSNFLNIMHPLQVYFGKYQKKVT